MARLSDLISPRTAASPVETPVVMLATVIDAEPLRVLIPSLDGGKHAFDVFGTTDAMPGDSVRVAIAEDGNPVLLAPAGAAGGGGGYSPPIPQSDVTGLATDLAGKQPLDADLTAIASLSPGAGNVLAADGAGWISKSYAALKTALGLNNVTNDAQVKKSGDTMTGQLIVPPGSAASPTIPFSTDLGTGPFRPAANQYGIATQGAERVRINSAGIVVTGSVTPTGVLNNGLGQLTAGAQSLNTGTTPGELEVATASTIQLFLPQISWGATVTPVYMISDPRGILTQLEIIPHIGTDFTGTDQNSINEGYGSEGAWDDGIGGTGPAGDRVILTTPGCLWRLTRQRNNPGVSGGSGGWKLQKLAAGGYV